ncbi:hypothetical protein [Variovorax sp. PAMC 28711]|uniref:hypothetical protein n=1 Tax=Variovorax sp. PAMC 28711 TaxID=1795631 RepID=UPI001F2625CB|nr:hypothetical protein [Variovorax sp. PAMC 28711]
MQVGQPVVRRAVLFQQRPVRLGERGREPHDHRPLRGLRVDRDSRRQYARPPCAICRLQALLQRRAKIDVEAGEQGAQVRRADDVAVAEDVVVVGRDAEEGAESRKRLVIAVGLIHGCCLPAA